jgi:CRP-like cAMP-binding protein
MHLTTPAPAPSPSPAFVAPEPDLTTALVRRLALFEGLGEDEIELLSMSFERVTARPGEVLETQDVPVRSWNLLADGHAVVEREATPIGLLGPGQSWSEHSMLNQLRSPIGVVALTPVTLLALTERQFFAIPEHHPVLAGRLLARAATSADRLALPVYNALMHLTRSSA